MAKKTPDKTSESRGTRSTSINIRIKSQQRGLIDRAVKVLGTNRSAFMLEAACKKAENILLDRRYFALEKKDFNKFLATLDKAPTDNERLRRTLTSQPPWER